VTDYLRLLRTLVESGTEFVLVGGIAELEALLEERQRR